MAADVQVGAAAYVARSAAEQRVEGFTVGGVQSIGDCTEDACQCCGGVVAGHRGQRCDEVDVDGLVGLDDQSGLGQPLAPIAPHRGHVCCSVGVECLVGVRFGGASRGLVGEEPGMPGKLEHGQQPTRADRRDELAQGVIGVGQMVQGRRCPDEVDWRKPGYTVVQIRAHRHDPVAQTAVLGAASQPIEHLLGGVDRYRMGGGEAVEQSERSSPGAGPDIEKAVHGGVGKPFDVVPHGSKLVGDEFGVEVEQVGETGIVVVMMRWVDGRVGVRIPRVGAIASVAVVAHVLSVGASCSRGISCCA